MTWRDEYRVHPAADVFPMMSDAELSILGTDIKANGMQKPIITWSDPSEDPNVDYLYVLDGRNRLEACERMGIDPHEFKDDSGLLKWFVRAVVEDPIGYVLSANAYRRHLTPKQRRDAITELLKLAPERSDRQIAKDVGVDHKTVGAARKKAETTGEIPHSPERVGSDGRTTKPPIIRLVKAGAPQKKKPPTTRTVKADPPPTIPNAEAILRTMTEELQAIAARHRATFLSLNPQPGDDPRGSANSPLLDATGAYDEAALDWANEAAFLCARLTRPEDSQVIEWTKRYES